MKEAITGIGYAKILFGMTKEEVINIVGVPDRTLDERDDGEVWIYNSLKMRLLFGYEEDNRLYSIDVYDADVTFLSTKIIGMSFKEFIKFMKDNGYDSYEMDTYGIFDTAYFEKLNTTFTIEFDKISSYEFSPFFKDENTIIWPHPKA